MVDGNAVAKKSMSVSIPFMVPVDEGFSVQRSNVTAVTHEYETLLNLDGKLKSLVINRVPPNLSAAELKKLRDELGDAYLALQ